MHARFATAMLPLLSVSPPRIAVAVSGGADSFCLLFLAMEWCRMHGFMLHALTVDHGLRPDSAAEALNVARWCQSRNIPHTLLHWCADKPVAGIQEAARAARRDLLCRTCQNLGIPAMLMGHQADDQAETMLMRLQRGTGLGGLDAMRMHDVDPATGIALVRPLLNSTRAELRACCHENHLPFSDDPSNDDPAFERVQMRQILRRLPVLAQGAALTSIRLQRANDTLDRLGTAWLQEHGHTIPAGVWLPATWRNVLPEIQLRVLYHVIMSIRRQRLSVTKLEKLAECMQITDFTGMNIAGCWIRSKVYRKQRGFLFSPEPARSVARGFRD